MSHLYNEQHCEENCPLLIQTQLISSDIFSLQSLKCTITLSHSGVATAGGRVGTEGVGTRVPQWDRAAERARVKNRGGGQLHNAQLTKAYSRQYRMSTK